MYSIDDKDTVVELDDVPQSSVGAPCPMLLVGEHHLHLAYYLEDTSADWDGTSVKVLDETTEAEPVALISFAHPYAHMFGPPNDEAFGGHPLASRGLAPYSVFEIRDSSWVRRLERMNSVHEHHDPNRFLKYHHYVFAFHDSTFECVAEGFTASVHRGSVAGTLQSAF
jgi:hypothetical protein